MTVGCAEGFGRLGAELTGPSRDEPRRPELSSRAVLTALRSDNDPRTGPGCGGVYPPVACFAWSKYSHSAVSPRKARGSIGPEPVENQTSITLNETLDGLMRK